MDNTNLYPNQIIPQVETLSNFLLNELYDKLKKNGNAVKGVVEGVLKVESPVINIAFKIDNFSDFLKAINDNFDYFYVKKLNEEIKALTTLKNTLEQEINKDFDLKEKKDIEQKISIIAQSIQNNKQTIYYIATKEEKYDEKKYNDDIVSNFLQQRKPQDVRNDEGEVIVEISNVETLMNAFYESQKKNSHIAPHVIEYIIENNEPIKNIKKIAFKKFSFLSVNSNQSSLIDTDDKIITGMHEFLKNTSKSEWIIKNYNPLIKFAISGIFSLDQDIITRLLIFAVDDILKEEIIPKIPSNLLKDTTTSIAPKVLKDLIGTEKEKVNLIKNIETLKILMFLQFNHIVTNEIPKGEDLEKKILSDLFQSFIKIYKLSLSSSMFRVYKFVNNPLKEVNSWANTFNSGNNVVRNLLVSKFEELILENLETKTKTLEKYCQDLLKEVYDENKKKLIDEWKKKKSDTFNSQLNLINKNKSASVTSKEVKGSWKILMTGAQNAFSSPPKNLEAVKTYLSDITKTIFGDDISFELTVRFDEILKDKNITIETINTQLNEFFEEIKEKKETELQENIDFVKSIGGEFFFKEAIKDEIRKFTELYNDEKNNKDATIQIETFTKKLQDDLFVSDDALTIISKEMSSQINKLKTNDAIGEFIKALSKKLQWRGQEEFTDNLVNSFNILNIKDEIVASREALKKINELSKAFTETMTDKTIDQEKESYVNALSMRLNIDLEDCSIIQSINKNLVRGIEKIPEIADLKKQKLSKEVNGLITTNEVNKDAKSLKLGIKKEETILQTRDQSKTPTSKGSNRSGYLYAAFSGSITTIAITGVVGVSLSKDLAKENKILISLIITAVALAILVLCVVSHQYSIPSKILKCSSHTKVEPVSTNIQSTEV